MKKNLNNKKVLILGMGSTGLSICNFLKNKKIDIYCWDDNKCKLENIEKSFSIYSNQTLRLFKCIYVSPGISKNHKIVKKALENKINISSDIELFLEYIKKLKSKNKLLAITGTNGKSTIALMIAEALNLKPLANYGHLVLENLPKKNDNIVLELSSFQLEYLSFIKPKVSIISNIKEDHISYHGNFRNYFLSKTKINLHQDQDDFLILNYDDAYLRKYFDETNKAKIIWVSSKEKINKGVFFIDDTLVDNFYSEKEYKIKQNLFLNNNHNRLNFAISYTALKVIGLKSSLIINSLMKFRGLPHRMEHIGVLNNINFYNDSKATNVSATCAALESFKKVFLIAGGSKKGTNFDELVNYSERVYEAYLIGETALEIKKVLENYCKIFICRDLEEAVKKSYEKSLNSKKNYPILLSPACASFDKYENYQNRGKHFKNIFNKILNYGLQ